MMSLDRDFEEIYQRSKKSFDALRGRRLFITGGTGFFGRWILGALQHANLIHHSEIQVTALTRNEKKFRFQNPFLKDPLFDYLEGDIRNFAIPDRKFDFLVHGATPAKLTEHSDADLVSIIESGTEAFLKFAEKAKAERILYLSSGAVYGAQGGNKIHAEEVQEPVPLSQTANAYAIGKFRAELLMKRYGQSFHQSMSIARCFAFVGPYLPLDQNFAIGNFILNCLQNKDISISSDGTACRSYLYAGDLVSWLLEILVSGQPQKAYNVGSEESHSIASIAETVKKVWMTSEFASYRSHEPQILIQSKADPSRPVARYVPSTELGRKELGLKEWTTFEEGIARTFRFSLGPRQPIS